MGVLALDDRPPRKRSRSYFESYLQVLDRTASTSHDPDPAYLNLARIAEDERRFDEALKWLAQVDDGPQAFNARLRQEIVLAKMHRVDEARRLLAGTSPAGGEQRQQLTLAEAQVLREARRFEESYQVLARALEKSPQDTALLYDAAMAAERVDRIDEMPAPGETNRVVFGEGIGFQDLRASYDDAAGEVVIDVGSNGDQPPLVGPYPDPYGPRAIDTSTFPDGTVASLDALFSYGVYFSGTPLDEWIGGSDFADGLYGSPSSSISASAPWGDNEEVGEVKEVAAKGLRDSGCPIPASLRPVPDTLYPMPDTRFTQVLCGCSTFSAGPSGL